MRFIFKKTLFFLSGTDSTPLCNIILRRVVKIFAVKEKAPTCEGAFSMVYYRQLILTYSSNQHHLP
jgi:hypothetical protein